jgi:hypothetical protein
MSVATYSDRGEDILQLVDECNQARIVDVDCAGVNLPHSYSHGCAWESCDAAEAVLLSGVVVTDTVVGMGKWSLSGFGIGKTKRVPFVVWRRDISTIL